MAQVGNIETLGNLYVITAPSIAKEEEYEKKQAEKRRKMQVGYVAMELEKRNSNEFFSEYEEVKSQSFDEKKQEIIGLLKKAGIHPKDFPFAVKKDKEGNEIGFVTKGKNEEEIKENIKKFKMELQKSIEKGMNVELISNLVLKILKIKNPKMSYTIGLNSVIGAYFAKVPIDLQNIIAKFVLKRLLKS